MTDIKDNQGPEVNLTELQEEVQKYKDLWLRAEAETANLTDRHVKDKALALQFALQKFVTELLPSIDNLHYALKQKEDEGTRMVLEGFMKVFNKFEIAAIAPAVGESFNPHEHEALTMQEDPEQQHNTITAVLQPGYKLKDRLLRPSRVIVSVNHKKDEHSNE